MSCDACMSMMYRMVGNFREEFIFTFFTSQEPFTKIKTAKFSLSTCKASKLRFNPAYFKLSTNLAVLTPIEACHTHTHAYVVCLWQLSVKTSRKSKCYVSTDTQIRWWHKAESGSNGFSWVRGYFCRHTGTKS